MRLPSVTIFFAAAACSVDVDAHAELSDIVATDGRFEEVQGHLRVQDDDDERVDLKEIVTSNAVEHVKEVLEPTISISNPLKRPAEMSESEKRPTKVSKRMAKKSVAEASEAQSLKKPRKRMAKNNVLRKIRLQLLKKPNKDEVDEYLLLAMTTQKLNNDVITPFQLRYGFIDKEKLATIVEKANKRLLATPMDYMQVFKLYGLQFAKDSLFEQPQLVYWVEFLDAFNEANPDKTVPLRQALLKLCALTDLAQAAMKVPNNELALRFQKEIFEVWKSQLSPLKLFTSFHLNEAGNQLFNNHLFLFWTKYVVFYNSGVKDEAAKVSIVSILMNQFPEIDLSFVERSDITQHLFEEIDGAH